MVIALARSGERDAKRPGDRAAGWDRNGARDFRHGNRRRTDRREKSQRRVHHVFTRYRDGRDSRRLHAVDRDSSRFHGRAHSESDDRLAVGVSADCDGEHDGPRDRRRGRIRDDHGIGRSTNVASDDQRDARAECKRAADCLGESGAAAARRNIHGGRE